LRANEASFKAGDKRMGALEQGLLANTALTQQAAEVAQKTHESTKDIVSAFNDMQAGIRVLGWFGNLAKPVGVIIFVGSTLYAIVHFAWTWAVPPK
jgi:hypothetical protein